METFIKNFQWFYKKNRKLIILGTGSYFEKCNELFALDINNEILFFVESNPKNAFFFGKKVINFEELENFLELAEEEIDILVCNSKWKEIQKSKKLKNIYNYNIEFHLELPRLINSPFIKLSKNIYKLITKQNIKFESNKLNDKKITILIKEWGGTALVYHHLIIGMLLKIKGYDVKYLFCDESIFGDLVYGDNFNEYQHFVILDMLKNIKENYDIEYDLLSEQKTLELDKKQKNKIDEIIYYNLVWLTRKITFNEEEKNVKLLKSNMDLMAKKINYYIKKHNNLTSFAFTGIHQEWGIWFQLCKLEEKGDIFTFEKLRDKYSLDINSPAVYQKNVQEISKKEIPIDVKLNLDNLLATKRVKYKKDKPFVLIPLNIFWDSAAFSEGDIFLNFDRWLLKTVEYLLNECNATVYVRQHPHEKKFDSGKDVKVLLESAFGHNDSFKFVDSESDLDTYDLIYNADLVLPNTSTVGIEAVMMGTPVIVKNQVYYANSGFVLHAQNEEDYYFKIKEVLNNHLQVNGQQKELAAKYLTLTFNNGIKTTFGHYDEDVENWSQKSMNELLQSTEVETLLNAIINKMSYLEVLINK